MTFILERLRDPIIDGCVFLYFQCLYLVFWLMNVFRQKKVVKPSTDRTVLTSATEMRTLLISRKVRSIDLIESYIKRIEEVNPDINAVVRSNYEEARERARDVDTLIASKNDEELKQYMNSHPLLGLPFTMKDAICLKGQIVTSGLVSRKESRVENTGSIPQRLLDAGAIFLAYTNVPELCLWIESQNALYGRTVNPYDSRRTPGGSSGGEGALHGAGASLFGIGSDLSGSIRLPSFVNGVFGYMATPGVILTPSGDHIPDFRENTYARDMARQGPITRFGEDLRLLLKAMIGDHPMGKSLDTPSDIRTARMFYADGLADYQLMEPLSTETKESMMKAVHHFEEKYGLDSNKIVIPLRKNGIDMQYSSFLEKEGLTYSQTLRSPLGSRSSTEPVNCKMELAKWIIGKSVHMLPNLLRGIVPDLEPDYAKQLHEERDRLRKSLSTLLGSNGMLFYPSLTTLAPFHNEFLFKTTNLTHLGIVNLLGLPAVQCPMGLSPDGIPTGVMIIGGPNSDNLLISAAEEISSAFGGWKSPGSESN